jgi:hypothetical protein
VATLSGKLSGVRLEAAGASAPPSKNNRLCVTDFNSGLYFLVDTGADVSIVPKNRFSASERRECSDYKLYAANNTEIKTFGTVSIELNLGLRRAFRWTFIVCDVTQSILGADFLKAHKLVVDLYNRKLIDNVTNLQSIGSIVHCEQVNIKCIRDDNRYRDILVQYPDITKPASFKEPAKHSVKHYIETSGPPVYARARPLPRDRYELAKQEFREMQSLGICRPSKSPWASPLHIVPKKDGQIRPCGDYRRLNAVTKPDRYPIPRLQDFTYGLSGKKIFSTLDINRAYHAIEVAPEDVEKTAVITPFGLWEFTRLPFGLRGAAQTFQRFMNVQLQDLENITSETGEKSSLFCYIDDIIIASENEEVHKKHLDKIFRKFNEIGLTIKLSKCQLGQEQVDFLGYTVSAEGLTPRGDKTKAIADYPKPQTVEQLRRFLGMVNFYRAHLGKAADIQRHLSKFLHGTKKRDQSKIEWDSEAEQAFEQSKESLQSAVTLSFPLPDVPLALMTDASGTSAGGVLQQKVGTTWKPLGYFSKAFSEAQRKYSTYDRELTAIYMSIVHFRNMVEGRRLIVYTDHKPLTKALSKVDSVKETPRRARQLMYVSEFTSEIEHISGIENEVADALSRVESIHCPTVIDFDKVAQEQENDAQLACLLTASEAKIKLLGMPGLQRKIYCEITNDNIRPYLPEKFRKIAFETVHSISHPGIRTTRRMVAQRYFWPNMNKDVGLWAKTCIQCQKAKINRHTHSELGRFQDAERFKHVHVDIVGPLPTSPQGYRYLVTMIDRRTRWPEAIPTADITAETVAKVIYENWICRFGCPSIITTDQGRQFESDLFNKLMKFLGVHRIRTTPYHAQANGCIERIHLVIKNALKARLADNASWADEISTVLLGIRAASRTDNQVSTAEMLYGHIIRLPGDFYVQSRTDLNDPFSYVERLRSVVDSLRPMSRAASGSRKIFVHKELGSSSHVFVRNDMVKKPLTPNYDGPYLVLSRNSKTFKIQFPNRQVEISIDRLKPAFLLNEQLDIENSRRQARDNVPEKNTDEHLTPSVPRTQPPITRTTRSGRVVTRPVRFLLDE